MDTGEPDRIGKRARAAIGDGEDGIAISAVVIWEVAIKRRLGKLDAPDDLLSRLEEAGVELLPITARHVAQAEVDRLTLVSADAAMRRSGVEVLW